MEIVRIIMIASALYIVVVLIVARIRTVFMTHEQKAKREGEKLIKMAEKRAKSDREKSEREVAEVQELEEFRAKQTEWDRIVEENRAKNGLQVTQESQPTAEVRAKMNRIDKQLSKEHAETYKMKCPRCKSDDIHIMGENKKSFSFEKAIAGTILTGRSGAIAGFAGKKNGYDCFCGDCRHRFLLKDK